MNDKLMQEKLGKALSKVEEALTILKELTEGIETTKRGIFEITKYQSNSGNTTWKADCEDGTRVYFRQAHKSLYEEVGMWERLNDLDWDSTYGCKIAIETIPDGDFVKLVAINSWSDTV